MPRTSSRSVLCDCTMYEHDHLVAYRTRTKHRENYPRRFILKHSNVASNRVNSQSNLPEPFLNDNYDEIEERHDDNSMPDDVLLEEILNDEEIESGGGDAESTNEGESQSTIDERESNDGSHDNSEYYDSELGEHQFHSNNIDPDLPQLRALSSKYPSLNRSLIQILNSPSSGTKLSVISVGNVSRTSVIYLMKSCVKNLRFLGLKFRLFDLRVTICNQF